MARIGRLTAEGIEQTKPHPKRDRWLSDAIGERNAGRLLLRVSPQGVKRFYFRYSVPGRDRMVIPLDVFTPKAKPGAMTLAEARQKAADYRDIHKNESRDVRAYLQRQEKARQEAEALERLRHQEALAEADAAQRFTLRALTKQYVAHLERQGKLRSANDARNIFKNHLDGSEHADQPAKDLQPREVTEVLRRVVEAGKGRTAGKLRSYLGAAYSLAIKADLDPTAPSAFIGFGLVSNPVTNVASLKEYNRARTRALTQDELLAYWKRLDAIQPATVQAALKVGLLLGGQRSAQLVRLRRSDVDTKAGGLVLFDGKGARSEPRRHELPITSVAKQAIQPALDEAARLKSEWAFTLIGTAAIAPETLTTTVRDISTAMLAAGEVHEPFDLRDVRRSVETALAAMGVSQDLRAQIQSHGLGGVQQKHYNRHDYAPEKRRALERWAAWLMTPPSNKVVKLEGRRAARRK
jgi:integrase